MSSSCPFCDVPDRRVLDSNELAFVIRDAYPVAPGHTLVISRRHIASFFQLGSTEQAAMFSLLLRAQTVLQQEFEPAGYNIGINDGEAAGQTVAHVHLHLIPRRKSDVVDPRGGIRWVLPEKARYWE